MNNSLKYVWQDIKRNLRALIIDYTSIEEGTDYEGTISSIKSGNLLRGAEFWLLICSVVIVSVGLDESSSALIIAGILISPILKPIIGLGLGFGIVERDLIFSSLKRLGSIIFIIFTISGIYFALSPLAHNTTELNLHAKPILFDILVAFFGGVAIIVGYSRRNKVLAFPRLIIGFMIIPPICTAAFGFVHTDPKFYFGAIYSFILNIFFISLAIYLVSRYLNFPSHYFVTSQRKKKIQRSLWIVAFLLILPSSYILYDVVSEARMEKKIRDYIEKYITYNDYEAIRWEIVENNGSSEPTVKIFVVGKEIEVSKIAQLERDFNKYYLSDYNLKIIQIHVTETEKIRMKRELVGELESNLFKQLQSAQIEEERRNSEIDSLNNILSGIYISPNILEDIKKETEIVFPEISNIRFGLLGSELSSYELSQSQNTLAIAYVDFNTQINTRQKQATTERLSEYLKLKFKQDSIRIIIN